MTNNANGISIDIRINGEKLDKFDSFIYLGAAVTAQGSKPEVLSGMAQTTAGLASLKTIWNNKHISLSSKIRLMRSLVISILLYASVRDRIRQAIRPYDDILIMACQDSFTRNSARREQKGPTKEALGE